MNVMSLADEKIGMSGAAVPGGAFVSASDLMTSSTSLTISGSRALVGSSRSMIFGCMFNARAMATRCCW